MTAANARAREQTDTTETRERDHSRWKQAMRRDSEAEEPKCAEKRPRVRTGPKRSRTFRAAEVVCARCKSHICDSTVSCGEPHYTNPRTGPNARDATHGSDHFERSAPRCAFRATQVIRETDTSETYKTMAGTERQTTRLEAWGTPVIGTLRNAKTTPKHALCSFQNGKAAPDDYGGMKSSRTRRPSSRRETEQVTRKRERKDEQYETENEPGDAMSSPSPERSNSTLDSAVAMRFTNVYQQVHANRTNWSPSREMRAQAYARTIWET